MIETERLLLRPWRDDDRAPFAAISADPAVMEFLRPLETRDACDTWINYQIAHQAAHGFCMWAVEDRASDTFLGAVGLFRVHFTASFTPAVEIGWRLARAGWGRGLATEAARASLAFGFTDIGLPEIVAYAVPGNTASRKVMERLGMVHDEAGDFDHPRLPERSPLRRHVLYRLTRDAWHRAA